MANTKKIDKMVAVPAIMKVALRDEIDELAKAWNISRCLFVRLACEAALKNPERIKKLIQQ